MNSLSTVGQDSAQIETRRRWSATKVMSLSFTAFALLFLLALFGLFLGQSLPVWRHEGANYLAGRDWFFRLDRFGAAAMIYGTLVVSLTALALAIPTGIGAAVFTSEYLPNRARLAVKLTVELLAGVPSVVYGLLGILLLRDWMYRVLAPFDPLSGDSLMTAAVLLAVMVLPTIMTLSDDALRGVPAGQRDAARGLGMTKAESVLAVALPQALPGIVAAVLLGWGRALGETIAVFLVVGRQDNQLPANLFSLRPLMEAGQTLTSKLGGSEINIAYGVPLHWAALVGLAFMLLVATGLSTLLAVGLQRRKDLHA
jgi:phosphate transport system permease protein